MPYRLIYFGLGLIGLAAIVFGLVLSREGESVVLPDPIESVSPEPGHLVPPQTPIEIDLKVGYEATLTVDGWPITVVPAGPDANPGDAIFVDATGVIRWMPTPAHPTITEWTPGEHTVSIRYDTYTGLPDTGTFEWTFRVG